MGGDDLRKRAVEVLAMGAEELGPRGGADLAALASSLRGGAPFLPVAGKAEADLRKGIAEVLSGCARIEEGIAALPTLSSLSVLTHSAAEDTVRRMREARAALAGAVTYGQVESALRGSWRSDVISSAIEGLGRAMGADILARRVRETLYLAQTLYRPNSPRWNELVEAARPAGDGDAGWIDRAMGLLADEKAGRGDLAEAIEALERDVGAPGARLGFR